MCLCLLKCGAYHYRYVVTEQQFLVVLQELIDEHNKCSARLVKYLPKGWQSGITSNC